MLSLVVPLLDLPLPLDGVWTRYRTGSPIETEPTRGRMDGPGFTPVSSIKNHDSRCPTRDVDG